METCKQCKYLAGRWCHQATVRNRVWNPYIEQWEVHLATWPSLAIDNRTTGKCGPERTLFEPRLRTRLWNWLKRRG